MKIRQAQEQLRTARVDVMSPRAKNSLAVFGNQQFPPCDRAGHSSSAIAPAIGLSQVVETLPCSEVIEERKRMAREIHDTLAQQFAGILLHLEAVNNLDRAENASECLNR